MITPLSYLLMAIPDAYASMGCLNRIQDFLKNPSRLGTFFISLSILPYHIWLFLNAESYFVSSTNADKLLSNTEKRHLSQSLSTHSISTSRSSAIELSSFPESLPIQKEVVLSLRNVQFGWKSSSPRNTPGITLSFDSSPTGTVIILVGPVGCGKSTFLKGLAGETPVLEGELFIKYPDLAFCDETPWLSNTSIRNNIAGDDSSSFDPDWYRTVVSACALDLDLEKMPAGDETSVGSKGSRLSGGQRQRIVSCILNLDLLSTKTLTRVGYCTRSLCSQTYRLLRRCFEWSRQCNRTTCLQQCLWSDWTITSAWLYGFLSNSHWCVIASTT